MKKTYSLSGAAPFAVAATMVWCAPAMAQDEAIAEEENDIIVAAGREDTVEIADYTGSVTVITDEQIEERQIRNVEDALRDVPGVAVSSVPGQTQIRVRGTEANQTLVLVDGIEVSDPASGEYDIGTLQAEIGSSVEVLRGPQSALWGNDALGGVVGYNSASGRELSGFSAHLEAGTNNTINGAARYGAAGKGWDAAISATAVTTDGEPNARGGERDIGSESYTLSAKGSVALSDTFSLRATGRYVLTKGDFNGQDFDFESPTLGLVIDSPDVNFENEAIYGLVGAHLDLLDGAWSHDLSAQTADIERSTEQPTGFPTATESDRFKASYVTAYNFGGSDHSITFAADYEVEGFNNLITFAERREIENSGLVAEYAFNGTLFDFSAAVRQDFNDQFGDTATFRVSGGYFVTDTTRLRAAVGTGIKNPTFNELFGFFDGEFLGNEDLVPEESTSWEVGVDQSFADNKVQLSLTYFNSELENEIFTDFVGDDFVQTPSNRTTDSVQQGIEVALFALLGSGFSVNGAYTYVSAEENGVEEVRRPEHTGSLVLNWNAPRGIAGANLAVRYNGEALDNDFTAGTFPAPTTTLDAYTLVDFNVRAKVTDGVNVFGRVENLLDEEYEQVATFVSPGISALAGIAVRF